MTSVTSRPPRNMTFLSVHNQQFCQKFRPNLQFSSKFCSATAGCLICKRTNFFLLIFKSKIKTCIKSLKTYTAYTTLWTVVNCHEWCASSSSMHSIVLRKKLSIRTLIILGIDWFSPMNVNTLTFFVDQLAIFRPNFIQNCRFCFLSKMLNFAISFFFHPKQISCFLSDQLQAVQMATSAFFVPSDIAAYCDKLLNRTFLLTYLHYWHNLADHLTTNCIKLALNIQKTPQQTAEFITNLICSQQTYSGNSDLRFLSNWHTF